LFHYFFWISKGITQTCSNASYDLIVDLNGDCGAYKCLCSDESVCETGSYYCPCPFLYSGSSIELDESQCTCQVADLCGPICPNLYVSSDNNCIRRSTNGEFTIALINVNTPVQYEGYFREAATRWEGIIAGDVPDASSFIIQGSLLGDFYDYLEDVDGVQLLRLNYHFLLNFKQIVVGYFVTNIDGGDGISALVRWMREMEIYRSLLCPFPEWCDSIWVMLRGWLTTDHFLRLWFMKWDTFGIRHFVADS